MSKRKESSEKASVRKAWIALVSQKPLMIQTALEKGLRSERPLGFLELGARLLKEVGVQEEQKTQIAIVFSSPLDSAKLRAGSPSVRIIEATRQVPVPQEIESTVLTPNEAMLLEDTED